MPLAGLRLLRAALCAVILFAGFQATMLAANAQPAKKKAPLGEGADLEIGHPSEKSGAGSFSGVMSIAFDDKNQLYVLDWGHFAVTNGKGEMTGNSVVQKFDENGNYLSSFPIPRPDAADKHAPTRLTVDGRGQVYVTQPKAGVVQQFDSAGKLLRTIAVPHAMAITVRKLKGEEQVVVVASPPGKTVEQVQVIAPTGDLQEPIALERPLKEVHAVAADKHGNLFVQADVKQIYKFAPDGKLLTVLGAGTSTRTEDGSELMHSVALDSKDNLYTMTWGNPGLVCRFDPTLSTVTQRGGQFKWADPWSIHSGYVCLAVDRNDRLWVGVHGQHKVDNPNFNRYHFRPAVVRTDAKFLDTTNNGVVQRDTLLLGLRAEVACDLPYRVNYGLTPIQCEFVVKPGNRRVHGLNVRYQVFDMYRNEVATGKFDLKLEDGAEARQPIKFTPPKFGWYTVACEMSSGGRRLTAVGSHVGVTPKFDGLPTLAEGDSPGGWDDAPRLAFCGHMVMRIHPTEQSLDKMAEHLDRAEKYGVTVVAQLSDSKQCNADFVRKAVERYKGRIKYWEIWNEPNFAMPGDKYAALVTELAPLIKEIDPAAMVLGPTVCGVDLKWHEAFYKAGGGKHCDIISIHDYEGHESIDPVHWKWKVGALREIMTAHGDAKKPIWQTERAITGVRGGNFLGSTQAVRVTLQRDTLETLGIPSEHNILYYLNEAGYNSVPSYIWSKSGPHPAALALRSRHAQTRGKQFVEMLDFGPTGNKIFWGLVYRGDNGQTITLRNLGTLDREVTLEIDGDEPVEWIDSFGNTQIRRPKSGKLELEITQMPHYLRLAKGRRVRPPKIDFGKNIAGDAKFVYSEKSTGKPEDLTNGILEVIHAGNPNGSISKPAVLMGQLPSLPQTLEIAFEQPRTVSKLMLFGLRADNNFCALLDYDLEYHDGQGWKSLAEVRTPCPRSDAVETVQCTHLTWYLDNHFFVNEFKPVKTDKLRVVVRRTTHGFVPDESSTAWGKVMPGQLMLREIEVYE